MTSTTVDADLRAALAAASAPQERAAVVGLDWGKVRTLGLRLIIASAVLAFVPSMVVSQISAQLRWERPDDGTFTVGIIASFGVMTVAFLASHTVLRMQHGRVDIRIEQRVAGIISLVVATLALFGAVLVIPHTVGAFLGLLAGSILMTIVGPFTIAVLPWSLRRSTPAVTTMILQHRALPAWQTLFGGRARWLLARQAISLVEVVATVLLLWSAPWAVAIIVVLDAVSAWLAAEATVRDQPGPWLLVGAGSAVVLITLALLIR